jgi:hypothetical protein
MDSRSPASGPEPRLRGPHKQLDLHKMSWTERAYLPDIHDGYYCLTVDPVTYRSGLLTVDNYSSCLYPGTTGHFIQIRVVKQFSKVATLPFNTFIS